MHEVELADVVLPIELVSDDPTEWIIPPAAKLFDSPLEWMEAVVNVDTEAVSGWDAAQMCGVADDLAYYLALWRSPGDGKLAWQRASGCVAELMRAGLDRNMIARLANVERSEIDGLVDKIESTPRTIGTDQDDQIRELLGDTTLSYGAIAKQVGVAEQSVYLRASAWGMLGLRQRGTRQRRERTFVFAVTEGRPHLRWDALKLLLQTAGLDVPAKSTVQGWTYQARQAVAA